MTDRKFYKRILRVEILSEEPIPQMELASYAYHITDGDMSGKVEVVSDEELNGQQAAEALIAQDSDPGFFRLDPHGDDVDR